MDSIKVAIKVRPLIRREEEENLPIQWTVQHNSIAPLDPELKKRGEPFYFDHIFDTCQTNYDVFNVVAKPIVDAALNGINGTIFAYGQTSSGKTFTMMGEEDNPGVIPLSVDYIFDKITSSYDREFLLRVSYIEIYNEKINDLLDKNGIDLKIKEEKSGQAIVMCKEEVANSSQVVLAIMRKGIKNRRIGETNMNERSSRSHTIFRITIESREPNSDGVVQVSQLNLVDLAGSERPKQTGATGDRFNEGRHINLSLSALGLVIMQLSESQDNPQRFVNFRDSKLTRILQTSLGGNAMTTIICAVTPAALEETQCTLAFASRAKHIKNKPTVNECVSDAALLKRYAKQLAKLKDELEKVRGANLIEMESKLMEKESKLVEKDRANQLLEERIELLKTRIVSGNSTPEDEKFKRRAKRRRTWGGPGTFQAKLLPYQMMGGLPTIKESEKTPEKTTQKERIKRRQSIIQTLDIPHEKFQTAFTDFELELIESEKARLRLSNGSSVDEEEYLGGVTRSRRHVSFDDDVGVLDNQIRSLETTPEKKTSEPTSPQTPPAVLRSRINFLMEEYNSLTKDHRSLVEFTHLEKQMNVEEAVEAAMVEHKKTVEELQQALANSEQSRRELMEQHTKLQSHSSKSDKQLDELQREFSETTSLLKSLKNENESLVNELYKLKTSSTGAQVQSSNNDNVDKESSSIFANNTYFDEINGSDSHCDSILTSEIDNMDSLSIYDTSMTNNVSNNKLDDSKKSKEISNAAYSEFLKKIEEKSSEELTRVMQDLLNIKVSLEDENMKLETNLRRKIREADDVKNDIRELKSDIGKLQETIQVLTTENTYLTSQLANEKECAKETEKTSQTTIAELNTSINTITEEKIAMEKTVQELEEKLKPTSSNDEETMKLIDEYKKTIDTLTVENAELSTNLMNKIEELDRLKVLKLTSGDHECEYRELMMKLSERNKLLESENIELSNNLMDKIEEYDRLKDQHELSRCKLSSSTPNDEKNNLVNISMSRTNLLGDEICSNGDSGKTIIKTDDNMETTNAENGKELIDMRFADPTVDDLLRMSLPANRSILEKDQNGQTIEHLLPVPIIPAESIVETKDSSNESVEYWKLKAEMLGEQVEKLTLLNERSSDLKITPCKHCTGLRDDRKMQQNEIKALNRTLEELQTKFDREFADTKILRTKASEDLNLSVCDASFNASINVEGGMNVSYVEERVQLLHSEAESLRDEHEKLTNLYREKCDEIDKLQDHSMRELTSPTTNIDSPRLKRDDPKLDRITTDLEKLQGDIRHLKKSIAGVSSTLRKFFAEKTTMQNEIEALKMEKQEFEEKLKDSESLSLAQKQCESLENKVSDLGAQISNHEIVKEQLNDKVSLLETEIESLKTEKKDLADEIMTEREHLSVAREKIVSLENEISRLGREIANYESAAEALNSAKSSLETRVQSLMDEKRVLEERITSIESSLIPREKVESLANEVTRMTSEMKNYEIVKEELEAEKLSLQTEIESLQAGRENEKQEMTESITRKDGEIESLQSEISRLVSEIDNSDTVKCQLEDAKLSLETQVEMLKMEKDNSEELLLKNEKLASAEKRIDSLDNEVSRLTLEIDNSNREKRELEEAKARLESKIETLKSEYEIIEKKLAEADTASANEEKVALLENEVSRLISEVENAKIIQCQLEDVKSSLKMENDLLSTERSARDEMIEELQRSLQNHEQDNSTLKAAVDVLTSEKNEISRDVESREKVIKSLEFKLQKATDDLEKSVEMNVELNDRLEQLKAKENEIMALKSNLETRIEALLGEKATDEANLTNLSETVDQLRNKNSTLEELSGTLESKLEDAINNLNLRSMENEELRAKFEDIERLGEETTKEKRLLANEITNLRSEITSLRDSVSSLRNTIEKLEEENSSLQLEVEKSRMSNENKMESSESYRTVQEHEKTIVQLKEELRAATEKLQSNVNGIIEKVPENIELMVNNVKLEKRVDDLKSTEEKTPEMSSYEEYLQELESARKSMKKEIMSLKSPTDDFNLEEKTAAELFEFFVTTIMSKEQEVIKALNDQFEREKRKIEDKKRQSIDAEKRATVWSKELEAEIERTQQDMTRLEAKNTELSQNITKLENLLMESNHENQMLKEKMKVLEADFDTLGIDLEKSPESRQNSILNSTQNSMPEKERFIRENVDTREMELSAKLRSVEKQYKEKLEELTSSLEYQKTRNIDLSNNLEGLEANERQLKNIVDMKTNELAKSNTTIERLQRELEAMTESYNQSSSENVKTTAKIDEITSLLKNKCDKLSEYKTKLETITPEYEKLKDQANERQLRLEKCKSEIECLTAESERNILSLKDRLDSEEIKSSGYRKQLADLTNRNTTLQMDLVELRAKCDELEISNEKLAKSMRNSTSKIRAEEEMEDLRDRNRILERNLDGAGNRINELQDMKTRLMKDLVDLRVQYEAACTENEELKSVLSSHRSSVADVIESREKYDALLQEKNRLEMELADKRARFVQLEKKIETLGQENEELKLKNKELDAEMDDIVVQIRELTKENSELDDKLFSAQNSIESYEAKIKELTAINGDLETKIKSYSAKIQDLKSQRNKLHSDNETAVKASATLVSENSELRSKLSQQDRGDSLSCGDSERSSSPALEIIRVDNRRRRSRNELFNLNRPLETFENNEETNNCRCEALKERYSKLEKDLALKNAKIATLELKIQSEVFPHMRKCKDLEEIVATSVKKIKTLKGELKKLEETRAQEMSSECERCRQWKKNKRDQASQCMPESTPIYMSGMSSGIIDGHVKVRKLEKDKATLTSLCRNRQKRIFELEGRLKQLEALPGVKNSINAEKSSNTDLTALSTSSKSDSSSASRQAMKENVPTIWDNQRQPFQFRRDWFN